MKTVAKIAAVYIDVCSVSVCSAAKQHTQHSCGLSKLYSTNQLPQIGYILPLSLLQLARTKTYSPSPNTTQHTHTQREREIYLMSLPGQLRENTPRHAFRQLQLIRWLSIRCTGTAINDVGYLSLSLSIDTVSSLSGGEIGRHNDIINRVVSFCTQQVRLAQRRRPTTHRTPHVMADHC